MITLRELIEQFIRAGNGVYSSDIEVSLNGKPFPLIAGYEFISDENGKATVDFITEDVRVE